jgi:hypothetical protein
MLEDKFQGFGRGNKFQVEWSVLAKCVNKVDWSALDLAGNSCDNGLEIGLLAPPLSGSKIGLT